MYQIKICVSDLILTKKQKKYFSKIGNRSDPIHRSDSDPIQLCRPLVVDVQNLNCWDEEKIKILSKIFLIVCKKLGRGIKHVMGGIKDKGRESLEEGPAAIMGAIADGIEEDLRSIVK